MSKKKDPNTDIKTLSKPRTWIESIESQSWIFFPEKQDWRNRLIHTMYEWSQLETSLELTQFCVEWKIPRRTFYDWRDAYQDIKNAIDEVKLDRKSVV